MSFAEKSEGTYTLVYSPLVYLIPVFLLIKTRFVSTASGIICHYQHVSFHVLCFISHCVRVRLYAPGKIMYNALFSAFISYVSQSVYLKYTAMLQVACTCAGGWVR